MRYSWWGLNGYEVKDDGKGNFYKTGKQFDRLNYVKKYKIKDYSPESQDKLCLIIMKHKRSGILSLIQQGYIEKAIKEYGCKEWASLPCNDESDSYYLVSDKSKKQPATPMKECLAHYNQFYEDELKHKTCLHIKKFINETTFNIKCQCGGTKLEETAKPTNRKWYDPVDKPALNLYNSASLIKPESSLFGTYRNRPSPHYGLDLFALPGTPIYACLDGTVTYNQNNNGAAGQHLIIQVKNTKEVILQFNNEYKCGIKEMEGVIVKESDTVFLGYMHIHPSTLVKVGDKVVAGQQIGYTSVTGFNNQLPSPHLHFEMKTKSAKINPAKYITKFYPHDTAEQREAAKYIYYYMDPKSKKVLDPKGGKRKNTSPNLKL